MYEGISFGKTYKVKIRYMKKNLNIIQTNLCIIDL